MKRAVRTVLCLAAAGLSVFGLLEIGLEYIRRRAPEAQAQAWHYLLGSTLIVLGVILFATSSRVAAQLTDDYDDEA